MEKDAIESSEYEGPRVVDHGSLTELTAGLGGAKTDWFGNQDHSGGYGNPGS